MSLSLHQINNLVIIERTTASISVVATLILIVTFTFFKQFRTLSNTLIFYASFANLFANVAALMGRDAIAYPNGAACQFQAFLLEMFMQSDPMWSCAMAVNVYLCIFRRYDTVQLRKMHWIYLVLCYGLPAIPALFCLFYRERQRGKLYGNATLWCWIKNEYSDVRIWSYYLPIWISIVISLSIYFRVGIVIYKVRADIRAIENESGEYTATNTAANSSANSPCNTRVNSIALPSDKKIDIIPSVVDQKLEPPTVPRPASEIEDVEDDYSISRWDSVDTTMLSYPCSAHVKLSPHDEETGIFSRTQTRTTFHPDTFPTSPLDPTYTHPSRLSRPSISSFSPSISQINGPNASSQHKMDKIRWAYTKSALLFTISILITWIPASINRVQGLIHPHHPNYYMNAISAAVLPLQGFWNTVIFFASSWGVVRRSWRRWRRNVRKGKEARREKRALTRSGRC